MVKNKFLLLSLEETQAKQIANTINNESARKILDYLSEKEATETQIAKDLNLPASTVNYNIENLLKAKLITWEKYHYSEKGKEVRHYTVANKYIIITPKGEKESFLEILKKFSPAFIMTVLGAFAIQFFSSIQSTAQDYSLNEPAPEIMMAKSIAVVDSMSYAAEENSNFMLGEPVTYFIAGSLLTVFFIVLYFYIKSRIKK